MCIKDLKKGWNVYCSEDFAFMVGKRIKQNPDCGGKISKNMIRLYLKYSLL